MLDRTEIEPLGRRLALAIAAGRVAIGAGALFATGPALKALGFADADPTTRALARLAGSRDVALGTLVIAAPKESSTLRTATFAGAAVDAADAIAFGLAASSPRVRRAGIIGAVSGATAALAGLWAWRRLSPSSSS